MSNFPENDPFFADEAKLGRAQELLANLKTLPDCVVAIRVWNEVAPKHIDLAMKAADDIRAKADAMQKAAGTDETKKQFAEIDSLHQLIDTRFRAAVAQRKANAAKPG